VGRSTDCDVLIVGGGPTGASLALLLAQQQVRVIVVDKDADIYPLPRAAHVDHEVMRIFQSLGVADEIMATSRTVSRYDFLNADGKVLLRFGNGDHPGPGGWPVSNMIHQPSVERCLRNRIAQEQGIEFRTRWRFDSYHEIDGYISAECATQDGNRTVTARFLIGADGTRSPVRERAGIELDDLQFDEPWLVIDTLVHDTARLPDANLQICDPARPTTCVLMGNGRHRWEFMIRPEENPQDLLDDQVIEALLQPWNVQGSVTIERKAVYRFNARVAKTWHQGCVLLAGDAAHQMPPFAGQGMCSGQRDAVNLAWKLGAVLRGAPAALLDDYQREREPNVRGIIDMSIMMGRTVCITDPKAAAERDAGMLAANPAENPPSQIPDYPPLSAGCLLDRSRGAGSYFPQLQRADRQRFDDILGSGPWLICRSVQETVQTDASETNVKILSLEDAELAPFRAPLSAWLDEHDAEAVLVRPDRYIYGTGVGEALVAAWQVVTSSTAATP
jgi:3-(3-hydroxy-phenyl)propionate hydroxylase